MLTRTAVPRSAAAQDAIFRHTSMDRVVHLHNIQIAPLDPLGQCAEIGGLMVRHADVPDAAFCFPGPQQRHDHVHIHEAVALHEVNLLAPQAQPRLLEAARGMTVVGEVLAGRPDLVANEYLSLMPRAVAKSPTLTSAMP